MNDLIKRSYVEDMLYDLFKNNRNYTIRVQQLNPGAFSRLNTENKLCKSIFVKKLKILRLRRINAIN